MRLEPAGGAVQHKLALTEEVNAGKKEENGRPVPKRWVLWHP